MPSLPACKNEAMFSYTWPGYREIFVCAEHAQLVRRVATNIGLMLELKLVDQPEVGTKKMCEHKVTF